MDKQWIQDIMSQQFTVGTFVNPIRLIMATCLVQSPISNRISRYLVLEYIYRTFADHKEIAERNPNIIREGGNHCRRPHCGCKRYSHFGRQDEQGGNHEAPSWS